MRRIARVPVLAVGVLAIGALTGCSSIAQLTGEALGVDVEQVCQSVDDMYAQYEGLLAQGDATAEDLAAARDGLVVTLEGVADDIGGQIGDVIRTNADRLANVADPNAPEAIRAIEQVKSSIEPLCG